MQKQIRMECLRGREEGGSEDEIREVMVWGRPHHRKEWDVFHCEDSH